jgi:hypothetical protein
MKLSKYIQIILLFSFVLTSCIKVNAQNNKNAVAFSFGLSLIDNQIDYVNQLIAFNPTIAINSGISYYITITQKIKINSGINNLQLFQDPNVIHMDFPIPDRERVKYNILEMPIAILIKLNSNEKSNRKFYIRGGYSFGVIQSLKYVEVYEDSKIIRSLPPVAHPIKFAELGLEIHQTIKDDYLLILGGRTKVTNNIPFYEWMHCWTFDIKLAKEF